MGFSIWHWIVLLIPLAAVFGIGYPIARILQRAGFSGWWAIAWFLPIANIVALWIFAYARWPRLPEQAEAFD